MQKVRKAIIPVAGLGTRFLPAVKAQPKGMLTIVDKPIIQYIVEEAVASGIEEIIFITSQTKRAIEDHFDRNFELEYRLRQANKNQELKEVLRISDMAKFIYVRQKTPRGLGDAIYTAKELIDEDEPFAVLSGDDVIDAKVPVLKQLIKVYEKYQDLVIGFTKVPKKETYKYGIMDSVFIDKHVAEIKSIVEKPKPQKAPSNYAITGRYILTPAILDILGKLKPGSGGEIQLTDAFTKHIKKQAGYACVYDGTYYDCGNKLEFVKATINFALKHPELRGPLKNYLKKL
jgi:UTP--glucose-1-phosphate uridylyltransferase